MALGDSLYLVILVFGVLMQGTVLVFTNLQTDMRKQTKLFRGLIICSISINFVDMLCRVVDTYSYGDAFMISASYLVNCTYFIMQAIIAGIWFIYAMRELDPQLTEKRLKMFLYMLPLAILFIYITTTSATGWLFYINATNDYCRGPMFFIHPTVCSAYIAIPSILALSKLKLMEYFIHRSKLIAQALFSVLILPFVILQGVMGNDYPLFCIGYSLAILVLFINRQNLRITIDELTGVSNRSQATRYLNFKMHAPAEPGQQIKSLYVLMVDIDKFKQINDTYGHVEGDEVLKRTASVLKHSVPRSFFIGRYGGDEFIIVGEASKEEEIRDVCEKIHENIELANEEAMAGYQYTVSVGYAVRNGQITSIPDFVKAADVKLYQKKSIRLEKK